MFAKPQKGLVPVGGNWYATPNTPQKPNYSDPFKPSLNPIGIDIDLIFDNCNFGIQATGFLFWMNLPSFQFLWHNPDAPCNPPPVDPEPLDDDPYPFPPEPPDLTVRYIAVRFQGMSNIFSENGEAVEGYDGQFPDGFTFNQSSSRIRKLTRLEEVPGDEILIGQQLIVFPTYADVFATHVIEWEEIYSSSSSYSPNNIKTLPGNKPSQNNHSFKCRTYVNLFVPNIRKDEILSHNSSRTSGEGNTGQPFGEIQHTEGMIDSLQAFTVSRLSYNQLVALLPGINEVVTTVQDTLGNIDDPVYNIGAYRQRVVKPRVFLKELPKGTPEPPPPPEKKKMDCCPELRALLKLALKRIGSLPASVPDNFTKQDPAYIKIESLAELMLWQMQQLDAVMGSYPIEIEVEDTDIQEEGNQSKKVTVPNAAEAIAEMMGMLMTMRTELNANLILTIKGMTEAGMSKKAATTAVQLGLANAEFLGYKLGQKKSKMPMLFSPNEESLQKVMQEAEIEYIEYSNDDGKDFHDKIEPILSMAARWNAQNWRRVTGDAAASLKEQLLTIPQQLKERFEEDQKEDFDTFTENAERGFTNKSGITNIDDPWGRPFGERPRVREIGQTGDNP